jgi:hypothetical protein
MSAAPHRWQRCEAINSLLLEDGHMKGRVDPATATNAASSRRSAAAFTRASLVPVANSPRIGKLRWKAEHGRAARAVVARARGAGTVAGARFGGARSQRSCAQARYRFGGKPPRREWSHGSAARQVAHRQSLNTVCRGRGSPTAALGARDFPPWPTSVVPLGRRSQPSSKPGAFTSTPPTARLNYLTPLEFAAASPRPNEPSSGMIGPGSRRVKDRRTITRRILNAVAVSTSTTFASSDATVWPPIRWGLRGQQPFQRSELSLRPSSNTVQKKKSVNR